MNRESAGSDSGDVAGMTEAEFQAEVERMCVSRRLLFHHCQTSYTCSGPNGFPDLVIAGTRGVIFAELKVFAQLRGKQVDWFHTLAASGARYCLWAPDHLSDGTIARELDSLT
jgi:hypothetical protein